MHHLPVASVLVFVISTAFIMANGPLGNFFAQKFNITHIEARPSIQSTFGILKQTLSENPFFGVGFGGFGLAVSPGETLTDTHNFYMKMLSEQGIIGISLFLLILTLAFRSGWQLYREGQTPFYKGLGLGLAGWRRTFLPSR